MMNRVRLAGFVVSVGLGFASFGALAEAPDALKPAVPQTAGFSSKPLIIAPMSGDDSKEIVIIAVDIAPGAASPVHTHPGDCVGVVIDGTVDIGAEGQAVRRLSANEAVHTPRGVVHQWRNTSDKPLRLMTTVVYDKGQPRVQVVPGPLK
ncbi:MAG: cupin domain-containing protein [Proteobacteria bacterium]|nr:cupin domain-containing protein [Pseudomonadota bacterium]MBS0551715.1 cupin domain-containing protein [Pseudomonadota bacterium]